MIIWGERQEAVKDETRGRQNVTKKSPSCHNNDDDTHMKHRIDGPFYVKGEILKRRDKHRYWTELFALFNQPAYQW